MSRRITSVDSPWSRVESENGALCWDGKLVLGGRALSVARYARTGQRGQWKMVWEATFPIDRGQVAGTKRLGVIDRRHVNELYRALAESGKVMNPTRRVGSRVKLGRPKVRRNSAAEDRSNDLIAVDNAPDGISAVTMLHYGRSRQYIGLYEWIPNKGIGFQVSFTWHLDEREARSDRSEAAHLTDRHVKTLYGLAKLATKQLR